MNRERVQEAVSRIAGYRKKYAPVLLVGLIGVVLLLWPKSQTEAQQGKADGDENTAFTLSQTERQLQTLLSGIDGAGRVELMLSLETGEQTIYQQDYRRTADDSGQTEQTTTVFTAQSGSSKLPLVCKTQLPVYRGAVVVCEGAERASVRLAIIEAVGALTGLRSDRITVVKMKCQ